MKEDGVGKPRLLHLQEKARSTRSVQAEQLVRSTSNSPSSSSTNTSNVYDEYFATENENGIGEPAFKRRCLSSKAEEQTSAVEEVSAQRPPKVPAVPNLRPTNPPRWASTTHGMEISKAIVHSGSTDRHKYMKRTKTKSFKGATKFLQHMVDGHCEHDGACSRSNCVCVKNKTYCKKSCAGPQNCERQFPPCDCDGARCGPICNCRVSHRECDPLFCSCDQNCSNQYKLKVHKDLEVRPSGVQGAGEGLFATQNIRNESHLGCYGGLIRPIRKDDAEDISSAPLPFDISAGMCNCRIIWTWQELTFLDFALEPNPNSILCKICVYWGWPVAKKSVALQQTISEKGKRFLGCMATTFGYSLVVSDVFIYTHMCLLIHLGTQANNLYGVSMCMSEVGTPRTSSLSGLARLRRSAWRGFGLDECTSHATQIFLATHSVLARYCCQLDQQGLPKWICCGRWELHRLYRRWPLVFAWAIQCVAAKVRQFYQ